MGCEIVERLAGAGGDDQGRFKGHLIPPVPVAQAAERVSSHQAEERARGGHPATKSAERIHGVIGASIRARGVDQRQLEAWIFGDGKGGHGESIVELRSGAQWLERLGANRCEQDRIELESPLRSACYGEVAKVGRVKASAKEGDARVLMGTEKHPA